MTFAFAESPGAILDRLASWREADAPTRGGNLLAYVFDTGLAELDELAAQAARAMLPVNGLDPTTFGSVARVEREVVAFVRDLLHGGDEVVGTATSCGTESNLLAVKTARDLWRQSRRGQRRPRLVMPTTAHGSFRKAAQYFDLAADIVPAAADGSVCPGAVIERLGDDVALVVMSTPSYPFGVMDPVAEVAAAARDRGIACHVDACMGGFTLPFWPGAETAPAWDFRLPGVTSIATDLHKFGFAPKGISVLSQRGRARQRHQFSACATWSGYPLVNSTMLGSKQAGSLAAGWAIIKALGVPGFTYLMASVARSRDALVAALDSIDGLRLFGESTGPMLALAEDPAVPPDRRVHPHHLGDALRALGWIPHLQPGLLQADGVRLPPTLHLTITPVTESRLPELIGALGQAADAARGLPPPSADDLWARWAARGIVTGSAGGLPAIGRGGLTAGPFSGDDADAPGPGGTRSGSLDAPPGTRDDAPAPGPGGSGALDPDTAWELLKDLGLAGSNDDDAGAATTTGDPSPEARQAPLLALIEALPAHLAESLLIEKMARLTETPPL